MPPKTPKQPRRRKTTHSTNDGDNDDDTTDAITTSLTLTTLHPDTTTTTTTTMATPPLRRLLICSLGNPGREYANTPHNAGHFILHALLKKHLSSSNPPLAPSRGYGNGLLSAGPAYTLFESPSYMNVSGPAVLRAWKAFLADNGVTVANNAADTAAKEAGVGLVVLHDDLESGVGRVLVKQGHASAKGHNGIKSIKSVWPAGLGYRRIAVGIGRPESRDSRVVADFVLRKMSAQDRMKLEGAAAEVFGELEKMLG